MIKSEIDSPEALREWLTSGQPVENVVFQGLDLTPFEADLLALSLRGCVFLGCATPPALAPRIALYGCLVFPAITGYPYNPFRTSLYTPDELFRGFRPAEPGSYHGTPDFLTYASYVDPATRKVRPAGVDEVLARRLHDASVADALEEFLARHGGAGAVAVMGGHDAARGEPTYAAVAGLCRDLTRQGYLMVSGGGPGVMEAANLGAYLAPHGDAALADAVAVLSAAKTYGDPLWLAKAYEVRSKYPLRDAAGARSLGVPTWFYGHEPPNAFATHVAKYFENSVREEGLLAIGTHGAVFAAGNGGTVQEVFQDACQNYYKTYDRASPMFLFGADFWDYKGPVPDATTKRKAAWPLLRQLAYDGQFENRIFLTDSPDEIKRRIAEFTAELNTADAVKNDAS